ncbi:hypothetical protein D3C80_549950 [compost metagenome]
MRDQRLQLLGGGHQIQVQAVHLEAGDDVALMGDRAEIGGEQQLAGAGQALIGIEIGQTPLVRQVQRQGRLVDLYPLHPLCGQFRQDLLIDDEQAIEQFQTREAALFLLAEPEVGDRAQQHRLDRQPQRLGLFHLFKELAPAQLEALVAAELGHQVVIVGVEPLGHLGGGSCGAGRRTATGHPEQGVEIGVAMAVTGRHGVHQQAGAEHLIVPGKIPHRQQVDPGGALGLPVAFPQALAHGDQLGLGGLAAPVGFEGKFQLALGADTGEAQGVCSCHRSNSLCSFI